MRVVISLIVIYLFVGVVVVGIQVSSSPCNAPVVLDAGHTNILARLDGTLFGPDNQVRVLLAKDVALWLPRVFELVFRGGMPLENFINATNCRPGSA